MKTLLAVVLFHFIESRKSSFKKKKGKRYFFLFFNAFHVYVISLTGYLPDLPAMFFQLLVSELQNRK